MFLFLLKSTYRGDKMISKGENISSQSEVVHMSIEEYKQIIIQIVEQIDDIKTLIKVYTVIKNLTS